MDTEKTKPYRRYITMSFVALTVCFIFFASSKFYGHYSYAKNESPVGNQATEAVNYLEESMKLPLWNISQTLAKPTFDIFEKAFPEIPRVMVTNVNELVFMEVDNT